MVLDCPFVELSIIVDWSESFTLFLDEEGSGIGTFGGMDVPLG